MEYDSLGWGEVIGMNVDCDDDVTAGSEPRGKNSDLVKTYGRYSDGKETVNDPGLLLPDGLSRDTGK